MIKACLSDSYDHGQAAASIVDLTSSGRVDGAWLREKQASTALFSKSDVKPKSGHSVIHLIAMGAAPHYPCNKNGDLFFDDTGRDVKLGNGETMTLARGLKDTHKSFETSANVYKEHKNQPKDGDKIYGKVLKSEYNEAMHRVELLVELPDNEWSTELERLAKGKEQGWSMACYVPGDTCSICGNFAPEPDDYCDCLKNNLGQMTDDGHQIAAINENMKFFDISGVGRKADRIAFGLLKAASVHRSRVVGGAELANQLKVANAKFTPGFGTLLQKLAVMEKEIECSMAPDSDINRLAVIENLVDNGAEKAASCPTSTDDILSGFASAKVMLSVKDFFKLLFRDKYSEASDLVNQVPDALPGVFSRMCTNPKVDDNMFDLDSKMLLPQSINNVIGSAVGNSFQSEPLTKRLRITIIRGSKAPAVKKASCTSNTNEVVEAMTQTYAQYKAAFCNKYIDDLLLTKCAVLSHYIPQDN